jgi:NAD(P)-dependent dehydrogenase (short-subunit alcohol dehydrogenase family)
LNIVQYRRLFMTTAQALSGKSALVTGGGGGFGSSCATCLVRDGAAVTLMGRTESSLVEARESLVSAHPGSNVTIFVGDGTSSEDVGKAMDLASSGPEQFEIVISTVGEGMGRSIAKSSVEDFMEAVSYNLRPGFIAIKEGISRIQNGGSFVFISSTAAVIPFDGMAGYCAGKAALDHLVRTAAHELGGQGHRFNAVRPGLTRTPASTGLFANDVMMARFIERIPLGRTGEAEEVSEAVRFLAGPESSWTTGQSFAIDGGNELRGAPWMRR